jgi:hypothetical protein
MTAAFTNINNKKATAERGNGVDQSTLSTFTGTKLDWLKCICFDRRLKPLDKVVALVIAQHLNAMTSTTMLSDRTIADETASSARSVLRSRNRLRRIGWLTWERTETANIYTQSFRNMNDMQDAMLVARETRREARRNRHRKGSISGPWEDEGVSRATFYRRLRAERGKP